jgi:cytochrome oxidase Cu insertion factor (SCO1/SenC/PrrC family)
VNKPVCGIAFCAMLVIASLGTHPVLADAQQRPDVSAHPWIGRVAPDFALRKVAGGELKLKDLRGEYVVIHFGASW